MSNIISIDQKKIKTGDTGSTYKPTNLSPSA